MNSLCSKIQIIAIKAGKIMQSAVSKHVDSGPAVSEQDVLVKPGHANFVTHYDHQVQAYLIDALSELLPEASFVGEEDGMEKFRSAYSSGYTFVIDPIDGTSNFMKNYAPCVTSIGLLKDGKPYLGVVYAPFSDQMFSAIKGEGAYENGKPIHTSGQPLSMSLVTMGTAPYREKLSPKAFTLSARYMPLCIDIRRSGSAAWDLCMVASGRIGLYFEPSLCLHDYAAAACIAMEAGAAVSDLYGNPLDFQNECSIAAASAGVAKSTYLPKDLWSVDWMQEL